MTDSVIGNIIEFLIGFFVIGYIVEFFGGILTTFIILNLGIVSSEASFFLYGTIGMYIIRIIVLGSLFYLRRMVAYGYLTDIIYELALGFILAMYI